MSEAQEISMEIAEHGASPVDALATASKLSKGVVKDAMAKGAVWLSRGPVTAADTSRQTPQRSKAARLRRNKKDLKPGDRVSLYYDPAVLAATVPAAELLADKGTYSLWHKPAGMLCQGSRWGDHTTLLRWAEQHLQPQRSAFIVHRIDRMTSGLVLLAHNKTAARHLSQQFAERGVSKGYRAIVYGQLTLPLPFLIENALDEKHCSTTIMAVNAIDTERIGVDEKCCELEISIATGRKHQIRRHLADLGYPIVGDRLYGKDKNQGADQVKRLDLQLRAVALSFADPHTGEQCSYHL